MRASCKGRRATDGVGFRLAQRPSPRSAFDRAMAAVLLGAALLAGASAQKVDQCDTAALM